MSNIIINRAEEGNLKNISLEIPRDKLVVFTGLSGSGKSTLAMDVIFQECQRQYLEAMGLQGINKPKVESIRNLSPAIMITQTEANKNPRSTVGTLTDIYTDLRMIYEKLSVRTCPHCGERILASECREELEKKDGDFTVYMYCSKCDYRMEKLTRTHFSYNTREGACKTCQGLGKLLNINKENVMNEDLSLEDGAVDFWDHAFRDYQIASLYNAFRHYGLSFESNTPVKDFSSAQKSILFYGVESEEVKKAFPDTVPPKTVSGGKFEGVFTALWRRMSEKGGHAKQLNDYFNFDTCPDCKGERLCELSRSVTVRGTRLPELTGISLEELLAWIKDLNASIHNVERCFVEPYILDLKTKIQRIVNVGLGYLSLDRQTITLSGGESQRLKLAAALDSDLTGILYILDEPTIGLHPKDTEGMITILKKLRDSGNTVIVIEHDPDVMTAADYIVDIGPGSGKHGGQITGAGTLDELKKQNSSVTGAYLNKDKPDRQAIRKGSGDFIEIKNASLFNLKNVDVLFPVGCLVSVTGVSGSGKSTLVFDVLANSAKKNKTLEKFDNIVTIEQAAITRMKRSNVATYSDAYAEIRKIFGGLKDAKEKGLTEKHFSFNTKGGRCENCEGLGFVTSNLLFFKETEVVCPVCGGNQFNDEVLSVKYNGFTIKEILKMSIEEAASAFITHPKLVKMLKLLEDVGLGYLELGQTLTTLSGGEGQRLKLAKELIHQKGRNNLYLMDEPTTGLHPVDIENFLVLLNRLVDAGNTVIAVEHNQQVVLASDWIVDLGPEGGIMGGEVVFTGTPMELLKKGKTYTAECLRKSV